ncbi:MAG: ATP phosphoribosyltransferase regulatory subunit, partial [Gammaproteobacteria bacterium]|nr:ATP phosphoribosyltransferase regulatory subunit [Gammaproteobacteria bacterium]
MSSAKRWLLPDGVEEILPEEARKLESLRREILDLYRAWGYELVITPLIEFLDSLLVGSSHDLDLHTFKLIDQLSGQTMGIRADITPQAARIDAHRLNRDGPVRLCYADNVLHALPRGIQTSRAPIRIGAEFYGHAGVKCDIEVICLMCAMLQQAGVENVHLVLGH